LSGIRLSREQHGPKVKVTAPPYEAICNLKNGKSPGLDMIENELLKTAQTYLNPCLVKLII
jgi:hypothetical protein